MPTDHNERGGDGFVHHACLYGSDEAFLAMAVPFIEAGLDEGGSVLAATTPANIELLQDALGERAKGLDTAETAYFGRRPVDRVAAFQRYQDSRTEPGRQIRMIAEPVWGGKSARQIAEWKRMESGLNVLLEDADLWMICPYDTRVVPPDVLEAARATHPACVTGSSVLPSAAYIDPHVYAAAGDAPLPAVPAHADRLPPTGEPAAVRGFVRDRAAALGLANERLALAELAVHEVVDYLVSARGEEVAVRIWAESGLVVCDLHGPSVTRPSPDAFLGFRPPGEAAGLEDGLWLARSLCESVEVRAGRSRVRIRLRFAGPRNAERR
ncbi:MEDS domain-containing protein [Streptomyces sp. H27-D2]|uniref:MEDS domain-containing protein n=1 Tax=Streptomyces sp. H27-D2 TaxID=3046304 RepID=UPI002DBCE7EA|nr:MEDS domain-containing protein [Streptomyces sp. H27-D2]MEC4017270.1 MEDS domain-containing protein [Streptomyces sp. H27-D2]